MESWDVFSFAAGKTWAERSIHRGLQLAAVSEPLTGEGEGILLVSIIAAFQQIQVKELVTNDWQRFCQPLAQSELNMWMKLRGR